jgi:APA family basic amino acid/polyamine antiporter
MANTAHQGLKKELSLLNVYALATGATISAGFFLLPGIAFHSAGPAMIISYLLAVLPLIPAMFSIVELGTAMPRAGGAYYFVDRSMGPLLGTIGGLGTWLALILKTTFALIGMGAYISYYVKDLDFRLIAAFLAILFSAANLFGAKKTGSLQIFLVGGLLAILVWFEVKGFTAIKPAHFQNFWGSGYDSVISTAGLVYISYVGVTNVASVSEEIKNPEKNLPLGIFLSVGTAVIIYTVGTYIMVGVIPEDILKHDYRPVATCAEILAGKWGGIIVTVAALFAFSAVANAGILSASRYPLAMSRDHLLPPMFRKFNRHEMPAYGIYTTLAIILVVLLLFNPAKIAKLASAFQLLLFAILCLAVIVMRESRIESYDPGYRSPLYPWMQIAGIIIPLWLITWMGPMTILFSLGLIVVGIAWYFYYGHGRVIRHGAIFHVFERLGRRRHEDLEIELRGIMKEKGLREHDPYDTVVIDAEVMDLKRVESFESLVAEVSQKLAARVGIEADILSRDFLQGTRVGATPVSCGAALPHIRSSGVERSCMVMVRSIEGIFIEVDLAAGHPEGERVYAIYFLVSPSDDAAMHLRILAQLASRIDDEAFMNQWTSAGNDVELKEVLLRDERFISLELKRGEQTADLIGSTLRDIALPKKCLVALIRRGDGDIIPDGATVLQEGDRLIVIGEPKGIRELFSRYVGAEPDNLARLDE